MQFFKKYDTIIAREKPTWQSKTRQNPNSAPPSAVRRSLRASSCAPEKQAIVVRSKEGLVEKVEELKLIRDRYPILGLPVLRGAVTLWTPMIRGVKALMYSADFFPEEEGEPSKLDLWLEKKLGSKSCRSSLWRWRSCCRWA